MDLDTYVDDATARDWQVVDGTETFRIAVVGLGGFARRALDALDDADLCTATAVVSGSPDKAERFADDFGVAHALTYDTFLDGGASEAFDAVYVVTPNARHLEHVESAAAGGGSTSSARSPSRRPWTAPNGRSGRARTLA